MGDDYSVVASKESISISALEAMNPFINAGCTNLVVGMSHYIKSK